MRICCVGGGSIGLLAAARLKQTGAVVTVLTRTDEQARLLEREGVLLLDASGGESKLTLHAVSLVEAAASADIQPEWILLTVKQKDLTSALLHAVGALCGESTSVVCWQNGLGHLERVQEALPLVPLYAAVTTEGARRLGPNCVAHTGKGQTRIGFYETTTSPHVVDPALQGAYSRLDKLLLTLNGAGLEAEGTKHIRTELWNKLVINTVINPITGLLSIPNGELLRSEEAMKLMRELYIEAKSVAQAEGVQLQEGLWERIVSVCEATARNRSSLLQDLEHGRQTEVDWLNGYVVRKGMQHGVPVQTHQTLYRLVRFKEEQAQIQTPSNALKL